MPTIRVLHDDALAALRGMDDASVDAVVTDPPYGLSNTDPKHVAETLTKWVTGDHEYTPPVKGGGFMGKTWDSFVPPPAVWAECMRVLKPGGHLLVFAGTRTQDLMGLSIRLAGFELRDSLAWIYGSGFPKSLDVSKAIDKAAGAEREVVGYDPTKARPNKENFAKRTDRQPSAGAVAGWKDNGATITAPATSEAEQWSGWGTALKPAIEPVIVARKPIKGTVAANVLEHGTGGINVDGCRVEPTGESRPRVDEPSQARRYTDAGGTDFAAKPGVRGGAAEGRFPPNVLLDPDAAAAMDEQSGVSKSTGGAGSRSGQLGYHGGGNGNVGTNAGGLGDTGGASRFFPVFKYQAKAPKRERPQYVTENGQEVRHSTVKPLELMRWLVRLVTPPGGTVLDPFAGSGTTGEAAWAEGFDSILVEAQPEYLPLIAQRIGRVSATAEDAS